MSDLPLVSVVVPARNEERDIAACLQAVLAQDYPRDRLEIIVVDGGSSDRTVEVAEKLLADARVRAAILSNPAATTPSNLNAGLAEADGAVLCRVDARSLIPTHYVRRCVEVLQSRPDVVVVGGAQVAVARDGTDTAVGIARSLNNRWGMGLAKYRRGATSGPADTVYLGCFRTDQLDGEGGWDERFATNQDFELNRRMSRLGTVWFDASLEVGYRPRPSLADLTRQYRRFGSWKVRYWRETGDRPRARQVVLLALPVVGVAGLGVVAVLPRPLRRVALLGVAALAVVFEVKGPSGPPARLRGHVVSGVASVAVGAGWSVGAWGALVKAGRREPPTTR
jgi:succinoglycan biosynthesis protein ExoA